MGIKFPFATFAKSSSRRAWVVKNANDDSKRNSKELQPKIDDALGRAERERVREKGRERGRKRWEECQCTGCTVRKAILASKEIHFGDFILRRVFKYYILEIVSLPT